MLVRPRTVERDEGSQQTALPFEAASTAESKGQTEDSFNDALAAKAATIMQLMAAEKQMGEDQKASLNKNKASMESDDDGSD